MTDPDYSYISHDGLYFDGGPNLNEKMPTVVERMIVNCPTIPAALNGGVAKTIENYEPTVFYGAAR